MSAFDQVLKIERFAIRVEPVLGEPTTACIVLVGRIDIPNPSLEIGSFLRELDVHFGGTVLNLVVDAVKLVYINSSGIKMMADWLARLESEAPYQLILKLNDTLAWHQELLAPLRFLVPEKIRVEYSHE